MGKGEKIKDHPRYRQLQGIKFPGLEGMKRRKVGPIGRPPFLSVLPAGDLLSWLSDSSKNDNNVECKTGTHIPRELGCNANQSVSAQDTTLTKGQDKCSRRKDMPVVRKNFDTSSRNSFAFMDDPAAVDRAMASLRSDFYAATSRRPRDALVQTWMKFHKQWFGTDDFLPLTTDSIEKVSCLFKVGAYKSFKNYLSRAKECHTEAGYEWTTQLQNTSRKCTRSVLRGLGGPSRSEAFDFCSVIQYLTANNHAKGSDSPASPLAAVLVGVYFLLRELELSAIDMEDVSFTESPITLSLPVSKVDWQAKGCRRTWSCLCFQGYYCPVHLLKEYDQRLRDNGRTTGPWLVSGSGGRCTKAGVTDMIREAVLASGGSAKDAQGDWLISGHTFRITGARTLASWGLDPITIQLLGRWGSSAVLGYLAETPLLSFSDRLPDRTGEMKRLVAGDVKASDMDGNTGEDWSEDRERMREEIANLRKEVSELATSLDGVSQVVENRQTREVWWVHNDTSKVLQQAVVDLSTPPLTWKTVCGWKFTSQPLITTFREPPPCGLGRRCPKCQPDVSSSSSSSSESSTG